jgi:hypothetical protein
MLVACTIDTGESQPDADSNEGPEKQHDYIYRRDNVFYEDNRSAIIGIIGIHAIDLRYGVNADAIFFFPGEEQPQQASFEAKTNIIAPLPLFDAELNFAFSPKWSVSTKTELVDGKYQDIAATLFNSRFAVIWGFSKHVGLYLLQCHY